MALRLLAGCALLDRMFDARSGVGQCLFERLDVQIVRARKVVVEAAMGQRQIAHQIADYGAAARTMRSWVCCLCSAGYRIPCSLR